MVSKITLGDFLMLQQDPILDEIRRVRHQISARFDHDPFKLVEYYMKLQETNAERLIRPSKVVNVTEPLSK
jgi:hypothetical protein